MGMFLEVMFKNLAMKRELKVGTINNLLMLAWLKNKDGR